MILNGSGIFRDMRKDKDDEEKPNNHNQGGLQVMGLAREEAEEAALNEQVRQTEEVRQMHQMDKA